MLSLLIDNDLRESIVSGLLAREPGVDLVRVRNVNLRDVPDPIVLEWAADSSRVVVTHDVNTLVGFAYARVRRGLPMPGVIAIAQSIQTGAAIEQLVLVIGCYEPTDLEGRVLFLPLQ